MCAWKIKKPSVCAIILRTVGNWLTAIAVPIALRRRLATVLLLTIIIDISNSLYHSFLLLSR